MGSTRRRLCTICLESFAERDLISYKYRNVSLLDVRALEKVSCECYATIKGKARELLA